MPTVSVIIPTYKHRDFILATLDSVFAQTYTDYEVIVVNDGSPDDTANVLRPLSEAGRIQYIEQKNQGQAAARNRGLAEAKGDFVAFLDDDDLWPMDKLAWQVEQLEADPEAVLVYGAIATPGEETDVPETAQNPSGDVEAFFRIQNAITSPGQTLIRSSALHQIGNFDSKLWGVDDWDLYIRLAAAGNFIHVQKTALVYRLHADNASRDITRMHYNACLLAKKHENFDTPELCQVSLKCRHNINDYYSNQFVQVVLHKRNLSPKIICKMLWSALQIKPTAFRDRCFLAATATLFCKRQSQYKLLKRIFRWTVASQQPQ